MGYLNACTFNYDNTPSDLYNLAICWLGNENELESGLSRDIVRGDVNMVRHRANQYGSKYSSTIQLDFYVTHRDFSDFTQDESRAINRWLSPVSYKPLRFNNQNDTDNVFYNAVCTDIKDVVINNHNGKHLIFECDAPFAYTPPKVYTLDALNSGSVTKKIQNSSDDGNYSPIIEIVCGSSYIGDVILENLEDGNSMTINMGKIDIVNGNKVVIIDTRLLQITDGNGKIVPFHRIGWNITLNSTMPLQSLDQYWFTLLEGVNQVRVTGNAKVKIKCVFPRKVGVV